MEQQKKEKKTRILFNWMHYKKLCPRQKQDHICSPTFYAASLKKTHWFVYVHSIHSHSFFGCVLHTTHINPNNSRKRKKLCPKALTETSAFTFSLCALTHTLGHKNDPKHSYTNDICVDTSDFINNTNTFHRCNRFYFSKWFSIQ